MPRINGTRRPIPRQGKVLRNFHDNLDTDICIAFSPDPKFKDVVASGSTLQMMTVTCQMLFAWAARTNFMKYNTMRILKTSVDSTPTASLSTTGTHAVWAVFDQQSISTTSTGDTAMNGALLLMKNSSNGTVTGPVTAIRRTFVQPTALKNAQFQDVESTGAEETYDMTKVMKFFRVGPTGAMPHTYLRFSVQFGGKGVITPATPAAPAGVVYDNVYDARDYDPRPVIELALNTLHGITPYRYKNASVSAPLRWENSLAVTDGKRDLTLLIGSMNDLDALPVGRFWFPKIDSTGAIISELKETCTVKISNEMLCEGEFYYAPSSKYEDRIALRENADAEQVPFNRAPRPLNIYDRTEDEILTSAVEDGALRTRPGESDTKQ